MYRAVVATPLHSAFFFLCARFLQATTSGFHTLGIDSFDGKTYDGAFLYVTFNENKFAYQSIEQVDPVDPWALLGSAGGMWGERRKCVDLLMCILYCRVPRRAVI